MRYLVFMFLCVVMGASTAVGVELESQDDSRLSLDDTSSTVALNLVVGYEESHEIIFMSDGCELIKMSPEGFWVKGVKVKDTPAGYQKVYEAFKAFLGKGIVE